MDIEGKHTFCEMWIISSEGIVKVLRKFCVYKPEEGIFSEISTPSWLSCPSAPPASLGSLAAPPRRRDLPPVEDPAPWFEGVPEVRADFLDLGAAFSFLGPINSTIESEIRLILDQNLAQTEIFDPKRILIHPIMQPNDRNLTEKKKGI